MLSRKNKDLRTIKEGVVGKYVKKETPPEMPSINYFYSKNDTQMSLKLLIPNILFSVINVWTTEPNKRARRRNNNQPTIPASMVILKM